MDWINFHVYINKFCLSVLVHEKTSNKNAHLYRSCSVYKLFQVSRNTKLFEWIKITFNLYEYLSEKFWQLFSTSTLEKW